MKIMGLLGGMSWESTAEYYRILNQETARRRGGLASAPLLLRSVDFQEAHNYLEQEEWATIAAHLGWLGRGLRLAGADFLVICTNTMHRVAEEIALAAELPLLHIGDATLEYVRGQGMDRVGLLGTIPTMEQPFLRERLAQGGVETLVPDEKDRAFLHHAIFQELCKGIFKESLRNEFVRISNELARNGAQSVIMGCTEIPLLLRPDDVDVPLVDTTRVHALAALDRAGIVDPEKGK